MTVHKTLYLEQEPPAFLTGKLLANDRRVLLFGQPGAGKSTLAAQLAHKLEKAGRPCACIGADPGSPAFGVPGALCLGHWQQTGWQTLAIEAMWRQTCCWYVTPDAQQEDC